MKICVFSDIHGNLSAFEAAYPLIMKESADLNLFLGDLCGYYFDEISVWHRLLDVPRLVALRGNHDEMFIQAADGDIRVQEEYRLKYGPAVDLFLNKKHTDIITWIKKLPSSWEGLKAICAAYHGSPWKALDEYIYPDVSLERFKNLQYLWVFLGHTHYPMDRSEDSVRVVNPGSLGQPRNNRWPSFAVVDLTMQSVEVKHFQYDVDSLLRIIHGHGDVNPYLKEVLQRMR